MIKVVNTSSQYKQLVQCLLLIVFALSSTPLIAAELRIAVASNFKAAATPIAKLFEENTQHSVKLIFGSTGKHYAQIKNGAPFDIFLAADVYRPQLLEEQGIAVAGSRFTYAIGKLMLWSAKPEFVDAQGNVLKQGEWRHLAIANPKHAPYGKAAQQVLQAMGLAVQTEPLKSKLVRGENIAQTFQFVASGNAELGLVAYAQLQYQQLSNVGSSWLVPQSLYEPIQQQAIMLTENSAANAFLAWLRSDKALKIIHQYGYDTP